MWGEIGLLGLLTFLTPLVVVLARKKPRANKENFLGTYEDGLWVGIVAFLIQSFFDTNLYSLQTATLFWIFWAVLVSLDLRGVTDNTGQGYHNGAIATPPIPV